MIFITLFISSSYDVKSFFTFNVNNMTCSLKDVVPVQSYIFLSIEAVATSPYLTSQVATYGVAFHDPINKRGNVLFPPYLDQLNK